MVCHFPVKKYCCPSLRHRFNPPIFNFQFKGEPWLQAPSVAHIYFRGKAPVLRGPGPARHIGKCIPLPTAQGVAQA